MFIIRKKAQTTTICSCFSPLQVYNCDITTVYPNYQVCKEMRFQLMMAHCIVYLQTTQFFEPQTQNKNSQIYTLPVYLDS